MIYFVALIEALVPFVRHGQERRLAPVWKTTPQYIVRHFFICETLPVGVVASPHSPHMDANVQRLCSRNRKYRISPRGWILCRTTIAYTSYYTYPGCLFVPCCAAEQKCLTQWNQVVSGADGLLFISSGSRYRKLVSVVWHANLFPIKPTRDALNDSLIKVHRRREQ